MSLPFSDIPALSKSVIVRPAVGLTISIPAMAALFVYISMQTRKTRRAVFKEDSSSKLKGGDPKQVRKNDTVAVAAVA
jgi:hypothetical protein